MIKGILLDIDGTLIASNDSHAAAWLEALTENHISADPVAVRRSIGMGGDHLLPKLFKIDGDSELGKQLSKRRGEIFRSKYLSKLIQTRGAKALLLALRKRKLKLVVATSASEQDTELLLKQCELDDLVDLIVCSSDVENSKPDPDIIVAALKKGAFSPEEAVMLGDTPYDVQSAVAAGVKCLCVESGGWKKHDLLAAGASEVFVDPLELSASLERSTIFN